MVKVGGKRAAAQDDAGTQVVFGHLAQDPTYLLPGRGAYLCHDPRCLKKAIEKKLLSRALHAAFPPEDYTQIEELFHG